MLCGFGVETEREATVEPERAVLVDSEAAAQREREMAAETKAFLMDHRQLAALTLTEATATTSPPLLYVLFGRRFENKGDDLPRHDSSWGSQCDWRTLVDPPPDERVDAFVTALRNSLIAKFGGFDDRHWDRTSKDELRSWF